MLRNVEQPSYQELLDTYFKQCENKFVVLKRGIDAGIYIRITNGQFSDQVVKAVPATFNPEITKVCTQATASASTD
jgi:hypothetical protein